MDIISHMLWAGAAGVWLRRKTPGITNATLAGIVVAGAAPDVLQFVPILATAAMQTAPLEFVYAHVAALPGGEPPMPSWAHALSHNLHCALHSVVIAGITTALVRCWRPQLMPILIGWWLHIALDVPTHSDDYYAVPLFYPLSDWGMNGVAWTNPWVLLPNYAALAAVYGVLLYTARARS